MDGFWQNKQQSKKSSVPQQGTKDLFCCFLASLPVEMLFALSASISTAFWDTETYEGHWGWFWAQVKALETGLSLKSVQPYTTAWEKFFIHPAT